MLASESTIFLLTLWLHCALFFFFLPLFSPRSLACFRGDFSTLSPAIGRDPPSLKNGTLRVLSEWANVVLGRILNYRIFLWLARDKARWRYDNIARRVIYSLIHDRPYYGDNKDMRCLSRIRLVISPLLAGILPARRSFTHYLYADRLYLQEPLVVDSWGFQWETMQIWFNLGRIAVIPCDYVFILKHRATWHIL